MCNLFIICTKIERVFVCFLGFFLVGVFLFVWVFGWLLFWFGLFLREMVREETVPNYLHCCCCNLQDLCFKIMFLECCGFLGDIFESVTQKIETHSGLYKFNFLVEAFLIQV